MILSFISISGLVGRACTSFLKERILSKSDETVMANYPFPQRDKLLLSTAAGVDYHA